MQDSRPLESSQQSSVWANWLLVLQYFILGVCKALGDTMLLTYPILPAYSVISLFTAAKLPFSFKFIIAPLTEHYASVQYGKRKTWIVVGCGIVGLLLLLMAMLTDLEHQIHIAVVYMVLLIFAAAQSVAVISLGIKQIKDPATVGLTQEISKMLGGLFGSLVFLKLVSADFGKLLGRTDAICSVSTFFGMLGIIILVLNLANHFFLKETGRHWIDVVLIEQVEMGRNSLWQVIKKYRVFVDSNSIYFRQALFFLILNQGHHFFYGGLQYELIKNGFSKERINELDNIMVIPIMGFTCLASWFNSMQNIWRNIWIILLLKLITDVAIFVSMPTQLWSVALALFLCRLLTACGVLLNTTVVASFPVTALSGVLVSGFQSAREFGNNSALHQRVIHEVGWSAASIFGFVMHGTIICVFWSIVEWLNEGTLDDDDDIKPTDQQRTTIT